MCQHHYYRHIEQQPTGRISQVESFRRMDLVEALNNKINIGLKGEK
jgi:hypothetical protein